MPSITTVGGTTAPGTATDARMGTPWDARRYQQSSQPQQAWASDVLAMDASQDMVALARKRLGDRAEVWCQDALDLDLEEHVDAILSTATLHWVTDHDCLWAGLARALRPGGMMEIQCGGEGNIDGVREVIEAVAADSAPELLGWSPWVFASPR